MARKGRADVQLEVTRTWSWAIKYLAIKALEFSSKGIILSCLGQKLRFLVIITVSRAGNTQKYALLLSLRSTSGEAALDYLSPSIPVPKHR